MRKLAIQQRCWNHDTREAVCRCPNCGRSFCRECVTEHEARLLCAPCLNKLSRAQPARKSGLRHLLPAAMALSGILLAWIVFYGAGEALLLVTTRMEQTITEPRSTEPQP
jgi:hypothetical protein